MKLISNKEYFKLKKDNEELKTLHTSAVQRSLELFKQVKELELKLEQAEKNTDLKEILHRLSSIKINNLSFSDTCGTWETNLTLSNDVLVYVDDILGGKVIKQEGVACVVVSKDGNTRIGLTKQKPDKGFNYKLIREK